MLRALVMYVCFCVLIALVIVVSVVLVYAMAGRKETKLRCPTIKFKDFTECFALRQAEKNNEKQMKKLLSYVKRDVDMYENKTRKGDKNG